MFHVFGRLVLFFNDCPPDRRFLCMQSGALFIVYGNWRVDRGCCSPLTLNVTKERTPRDFHEETVNTPPAELSLSLIIPLSTLVCLPFELPGMIPRSRALSLTATSKGCFPPDHPVRHFQTNCTENDSPFRSSLLEFDIPDISPSPTTPQHQLPPSLPRIVQRQHS